MGGGKRPRHAGSLLPPFFIFLRLPPPPRTHCCFERCSTITMALKCSGNINHKQELSCRCCGIFFFFLLPSILFRTGILYLLLTPRTLYLLHLISYMHNHFISSTPDIWKKTCFHPVCSSVSILSSWLLLGCGSLHPGPSKSISGAFRGFVFPLRLRSPLSPRHRLHSYSLLPLIQRPLVSTPALSCLQRPVSQMGVIFLFSGSDILFIACSLFSKRWEALKKNILPSLLFSQTAPISVAFLKPRHFHFICQSDPVQTWIAL